MNDIAARLSVLDPDGAGEYRANANLYIEELDVLHHWIEEQVAQIPEERRLLITSHDSLGYFAGEFGFEVVETVFGSGTTEAEPSAEHLAELVEEVRAHQVPAVFGETTVSERLAQAIANETGARLVRLYSGSLGPEGSGAETYLGMMRVNVTNIVEALT